MWKNKILKIRKKNIFYEKRHNCVSSAVDIMHTSNNTLVIMHLHIHSHCHGNP